MKKSRKGKKPNHRAFIHAAFKEATKGSYTMYGCCMDHPIVTNAALPKSRVPEFKLWLEHTKFTWKTWMCVFFVKEDGEKKCKIEIHETPYKMNTKEAEEYMTPKLIRLVDSVQTKHFVSKGYVNTYNNADLDEQTDKLLDMFNEHGAYDLSHCEKMYETKRIRQALEGMAA